MEHSYPRRGIVVVLGLDLFDAAHYAGVAGLTDVSTFSPANIRPLEGHRIYCAYITPTARQHPNFPKAFAVVRRNLFANPGADRDVIYLEDDKR